MFQPTKRTISITFTIRLLCGAQTTPAEENGSLETNDATEQSMIIIKTIESRAEIEDIIKINANANSIRSARQNQLNLILVFVPRKVHRKMLEKTLRNIKKMYKNLQFFVVFSEKPTSLDSAYWLIPFEC